MAQKFYVGNYGGPLTVDVFASDGETPVLPVSATVDIFNMETGAQVLSQGMCSVSSGLAAYTIPEGASYMDAAGRFVAYFDVLIETGNKQTEEVYFNVYAKSSSLIIERWRIKVQDSAPTEEHIDDDKARDWIDQAVGWINKRYTSGYTSTLASIDPVPTDYDLEFIAYVASFLARKAWYAGRGSYRDDEISYDARSIQAEEDALEKYFVDLDTSGIYDILDGPYESVTNRNRDGVFYRGRWFEDIYPVSNPYYTNWTGV
jgi:hypothetical protein